MKPLLNTGTMTVEFCVTEDELRARLLQEAMETLHLSDATSGIVRRGDSRRGGYVVRITRDVQPALPRPGREA